MKVTFSDIIPFISNHGLKRLAAQGQNSEDFFETAEEFWIPAGKRAQSRTRRSARKRNEFAENTTSTSARSEQTFEKLETGEVQTVNFATDKHFQKTSFELQRFRFLRVTTSSSIPSYQWSVEVSRIGEIPFKENAKDAIVNAKIYKCQRTIGVTRITKVSTYFLLHLHTCSGPNPNSKSIVLHRGEISFSVLTSCFFEQQSRNHYNQRELRYCTSMLNIRKYQYGFVLQTNFPWTYVWKRSAQIAIFLTSHLLYKKSRLRTQDLFTSAW